MASGPMSITEHHASIYNASWIASSSSAALTNLTETKTLPKGKWLAVGSLPICSRDITVCLRATSGTTTIGNNVYEEGGTYTTIVRIFEITSDSADVVLRTGVSTPVDFTTTERGYMQYIKLAV